MKTKILLCLLVVAVGIACAKNVFTTKPQLEFKKVNTNVLSRNQLLKFTLGVTDAEGDIQDSIWIQKVVRNCNQSNFTAKYKMPVFSPSKNLKAEIEICFGYGGGLGCPLISEPRCSNRNDTAIFRFWIKDKGGNVSDTIISPTIVQIK